MRLLRSARNDQGNLITLSPSSYLVKLLSYLQQQYHFPRRTITQLIKEGKILINETKIEGFSHILKNGDSIDIVWLWKKEAKIDTTTTNSTQLIAFNKPAGYVVSKADTHNPTIFEILPIEYEHYYPIGRLDKESTGLLLLSNDSKLVHELSHPSKEHLKVYHLRLHKLISENDTKAMLKGVNVDGDGYLEWAYKDPKEQVKKVYSGTPRKRDEEKLDLLSFKTIKNLWSGNYEITLTEGKNRHIRRLCKALGYRVESLHRVSFGKWKLWNIALWSTLPCTQ